MAKKQQDILTQKGLFERLIRLEEKIDMKTNNDIIVAKRFKGFTYIIIAIQLVNSFVNYLIYISIRR